MFQVCRCPRHKKKFLNPKYFTNKGALKPEWEKGTTYAAQIFQMSALLKYYMNIEVVNLTDEQISKEYASLVFVLNWQSKKGDLGNVLGK